MDLQYTLQLQTPTVGLYTRSFFCWGPFHLLRGYNWSTRYVDAWDSHVTLISEIPLMRIPFNIPWDNIIYHILYKIMGFSKIFISLFQKLPYRALPPSFPSASIRFGAVQPAKWWILLVILVDLWRRWPKNMRFHPYVAWFDGPWNLKGMVHHGPKNFKEVIS